VPRHIVLLTRDASLVVAVRALLTDEDRVSELESPQELPAVGELPVDAVVVDLPPPSRGASVERVRGRFSGPLVVLLGHGEDPARARVTYRCSVLTRPFGMAQLWTILVDSATEAVTEVIPALRREPPQAQRRDQPASSPERPTPATERERAPASPERAPAPTPERRGAERRGQVAEERGQVAEERGVPVAERPTSPVAERIGEPAPVAERAAMLGSRGATRVGGAGGQQEPPRPPDPPPGESERAPAWSWRLRRFQHAPAEAAAAGELTQPMAAVPPATLPPVAVPQAGNGFVPTPEFTDHPAEAVAPVPTEAQLEPQVDPAVEAPVEAPAEDQVVEPPAEALAVPDTRSGARDETEPDPPEAVAGRLAERLTADAVALLLDNNRGLLEVAGGVGLTTKERQLQVEYGHEVLRELFRVGVGLIEDTDRVRAFIHGIPGSRSQSLVMVPLVHEGHGFGALIVGRTSPRGEPPPEFTEPEIEALMDFAEDVAAPLRSTVLLRRLKGQLNIPNRT
jgi:hypothetical protein